MLDFLKKSFEIKVPSPEEVRHVRMIHHLSMQEAVKMLRRRYLMEAIDRATTVDDIKTILQKHLEDGHW